MADQLLKPEELVMYRPAIHGGLGVLHVKMAGLSKTFLETAGHEKFRTSQYHSMLYRYMSLVTFLCQILEYHHSIAEISSQQFRKYPIHPPGTSFP